MKQMKPLDAYKDFIVDTDIEKDIRLLLENRQYINGKTCEILIKKYCVAFVEQDRKEIKIKNKRLGMGWISKAEYDKVKNDYDILLRYILGTSQELNLRLGKRFRK